MMRFSSKVLLAGLLSVSVACSAATMHSITKDQMKQAFVNKTSTSISTAQLNGKNVDNAFTGYFDDKGNMWGKFASEPADAPQTDQGTYKIKNNGSLCLTWQHWMDAKQFCVNAYETTNSYIIIDDKNMFHTVFMKTAMQAGKQM